MKFFLMKFFAVSPDRRWLAWWQGRPAVLALDIAVVAACAWLPALSSSDGIWERLAFCLALPALLVRRRFPWLPVFAAPLICCSQASAVPSMVACYTAARQWGPRWRTLLSFLLVAGCLVAGFWDPRPHDGVPYQLIVPTAWVAAPTLVGLWMYQRRMLLEALRDRVRQAEREQDLLTEQAVTAERRRIAREMHDVVAHHVSIIALQAGALSVTAPDEDTVQTAEVIRSASAMALTELREILEVLRKDQHELPSSHGLQPGGSVRADVAALVGDAVAAGGNIRLHAPAELPEVPGAVRRAARRVAQEALTNAVKHAPHARVDVHLTVEHSELHLTVTNGRGGQPAAGQAVPGSGHGLIGMRERVTLTRGTLHAGPAEDGGYRVHAAFPLSHGNPEEPA
jgi:signal transduction histidine kinase